ARWRRTAPPPYHRPPLTKRVLRGEAEPESAIVLQPEWYTEHRVDLHTDHVVYSLDEVQAETIVLATGARPRELAGARTFRTMDDSIALRNDASEGKTATVIGGGFIGCEIAA